MQFKRLQRWKVTFIDEGDRVQRTIKIKEDESPEEKIKESFPEAIIKKVEDVEMGSPRPGEGNPRHMR